MDYKDLEALADMTMSQLERKFKKSKGDLFFSKIEKYGLGIE